MNATCNNCNEHGLSFFSTHIQPHEYIEGKRNAEIWIIGLNPKDSIGKVEERTHLEFEKFNPNCHPYFRDFKNVSEKLYENWTSDDSKVAHTDLVKCFSPSFPPTLTGNSKERNFKVKQIIQNCTSHLKLQLQQNKPKVVICNGSEVCWQMLNIFPHNTTQNTHEITSYQTSLILPNGTTHKFWIVLSGFIGRIDNRNRRRLGKEIEQILLSEKISL